MEMLDSGERLIREWDSSGMEHDEWCCCEAQGGFHRQGPPLLKHYERRLRRMVRLLALACVLLISLTLASVIAFVLVVRDHRASANQHVKHPDNSSAGDAEQQQLRDVKSPRAMLTAPLYNSSQGKYLQWEKDTGVAFCEGGFNYSEGSLVVPEDGLYRVFLQITYEKACKKEENCENLKLLNKVFYYSEDYAKDTRYILSSVDTVNCSIDCGELWRKSIYTSGIFRLVGNGLLRVTSSHPELIAKCEQEVFFGAERLPP